MNVTVWAQSNECAGHTKAIPSDFYLQNPTLRLADRWGNFYHPLEVAISDAMAQNMTATCQAGLFTLHFQDVMANNGLGFDAVTEGALRRNVVKEVFEDLSASLDHAPYNGRVHLLIESSTATNGTNDELAYGSAITLFPTGAAQNNFQTVLYKTIRSGASAYQNTPLQNGTFYQGLLGFNFGTSNLYNLDYQTNTYTQPYDLYTVTLHKALHLLGLAHVSSDLSELNRSLSQAEREGLNDLGYEMTEEYGDDDQETPYVAYTIQPIKSCNPLANDDFYTVANGATLTINSEGLLPMVGYLNNDLPNVAASVNVSAVTQVTAGAGNTMSLPNVPFTITFNAAAGFTGWVEITYVLNCDPMGNTASQGTIWIWVGAPNNLTCPAQNVCGENIVCYGDFEAVTDMNAAPFSAFDIVGTGVQSPDLHVGGINLTALSFGIPPFQSFDNICGFFTGSGNQYTNPAPSNALVTPNNNYLGMGALGAGGVAVYSEGVTLPLSIPLQPGDNFQLQYEAYNFTECGIDLQFMLSDAFPCPPPTPMPWAACGINAAVPINTATTAGLLPQPTIGANQWETHTLNLSVPVGFPTPVTHIVVFAQLPVVAMAGSWHYGFIDNVSIIREPVTIDKKASTPLNGSAFQIGETVTYTVTVTNTSAGNSVNNVSITDILPEYGLDFTPPLILTGNTSAGITATLTNNQLQSNSFTLLPSQSLTLEYEFVVTAQCSLNLVNCATVHSPTNVNCVSESCVNIQTQGLPVYDVTQNTLPYIISDAVQLSGNLTIAAGNTLGGILGISDSRVVMPEGTRILVEQNAVLSITKNSILEGCNTMWRGIELNEGNVEVLLSTIQDAEKAIQVSDRSSVLLNDAQLLHNVIGLNMNVNATPINVIHDIFGETVFDGGQPFLPPYNGQSLLPGNIGYAGIVANNVLNGLDLNAASPAFPVNDNVTFRNLNIGVLAENGVEVKVNRCTFEDIRSDLFYASTPYNGTALVARSGCNFFHTGWGGTAASPLTFSGCEQGIYLERIRKAYIRQCRFAENANFDCRNAIIVRDNDGFSYTNILNNHISAQANGVVLLNNLSPQRIAVEENTILMHSATLANAGINVTNAGINNASNILLRQNNINLDRARIGILLNNTFTVKAHYNPVSMTATPIGVGHRGISILGGLHNSIQCNPITSAGFDNSPNQVGIFNSMSDENAIICNQVGNTRFGIRFNGPSEKTVLQRNHMTDHDFGLWLSASTIYGEQGFSSPTSDPCLAFSSENIWGNFGATQTYAHLDAVNFPSSVGNIALSATHVKTLPPVLQTNPNFGFIFQENICASAPLTCATHCDILLGQPQVSDNLTETEYLTAQDLLGFEEYEEEIRWQLRRDLYQKLKDNPNLLIGNSLMQNFYTQYEQTELEDFSSISQKEGEINALGSSQNAQIEAITAQIAALQLQLRYYDSLLIDTLADNDTLLLVNTQQSLIAQIASLQENIHQLENAVDSTIIVLSDSILTRNGMISVSETYTENEKIVNEVYQATLAREINTLTEEQISLLEGIIHQCPLAGGKAVFRARALYAMHDLNYSYDDIEVCNSQGISWREVKPQQVLKEGLIVYPNPATKEVKVKITSALAGQALTFYNQLGQKVRNSTLATDTEEAIINIADLPTGVYFLQCATYTTKLIVTE